MVQQKEVELVVVMVRWLEVEKVMQMAKMLAVLMAVE